MKKDLGVFAIMLVVEFLEVTINTVSKAAMTRGMNDFVFVMYSNAFGACFLLPLTLIFFRYNYNYYYYQLSINFGMV